MFTLGVEVHRLMPKLYRAEVTRAEHRLPRYLQSTDLLLPAQ